MKQVKIGIIGSGFIAAIHTEALRKVAGIDVRVVACASPRHAADFAGKYGIERAVAGYQELLKMPDLDVVDVCVPNHLHKEVILAAAQSGKDLICEKPLTGYFGRPDDPRPIGEKVAKEVMLERVQCDIDEIRQAVTRAGVKLMYAENWVYAPPVTKAKRIIAASNARVLSQRAEESHSGSHAAYSREWATAGGGSLLRLGSHPVAAAIHLKHYEGLLKNGAPIRVKSVIGDVGNFLKIPGVAEESKGWLAGGWVDVEDWSTATLTFEDGTKAIIVASDTIMGGVRNIHEIFLSCGVVQCNMNPNNGVMLYTPDHQVVGAEYIAEKVETKAGWQFAAPDEDWMRGYPHEMQDFMESVAENREPVSGLELACETAEVVYAIYLAAATGRRVDLL